MKTHLFCIVDRSGSMAGLEEATIDGYNEYVDGLRNEKDVNLTLVLFDDRYEVVMDDRPIKQVPKLDKETYFARGMTALIDATCRTINERKGRVGKQDKAIVLIITDGYENSSHEYKSHDMKKLISSLEEKGNWVFTYLGANQDAWSVAQDWGFSSGNVASYNATPRGTVGAFQNIGLSTANMVQTASVSPDVSMTSLNFFDEKQKAELKSTI